MFRKFSPVEPPYAFLFCLIYFPLFSLYSPIHFSFVFSDPSHFFDDVLQLHDLYERARPLPPYPREGIVLPVPDTIRDRLVPRRARAQGSKLDATVELP